MKNSTKITLTVALLSTLVLGNVVKAVNTTQKQGIVATVKTHTKIVQVAEAIDGDGEGETNDDIKESQESAQLESLAKITPQQAQQVAEEVIGSQATAVRLENEDGNLVYSVIIGQNDVKIDAGNGTFLYSDNPKAEVNEKNLPYSSIRISESINGDGDGETNDDH
ncbi:hypothetical protein [Geminocystis sp. GBBB08]|uniref:PepSY domain-containing protein n=1 Tax=Geminocystis sp. GBBB08 TaxID=2604140 RepID=UPI0027E227B8|nr:hypothetical protein [Geminocystis sp. GBBB08]MBL1210023.1 peptidase [Geminocystis sp. GBBB08]